MAKRQEICIGCRHRQVAKSLQGIQVAFNSRRGILCVQVNVYQQSLGIGKSCQSFLGVGNICMSFSSTCCSRLCLSSCGCVYIGIYSISVEGGYELSMVTWKGGLIMHLQNIFATIEQLARCIC